jgi:hypothetical protein
MEICFGNTQPKKKPKKLYVGLAGDITGQLPI